MERTKLTVWLILAMCVFSASQFPVPDRGFKTVRFSTITFECPQNYTVDTSDRAFSSSREVKLLHRHPGGSLYALSIIWTEDPYRYEEFVKGMHTEFDFKWNREYTCKIDSTACTVFELDIKEMTYSRFYLFEKDGRSVIFAVASQDRDYLNGPIPEKILKSIRFRQYTL